jgi:hypothetical protein
MRRRLLCVLAAMTMVNVSAWQGGFTPAPAGPAAPQAPRAPAVAPGGPAAAAAAATPATGLILGRVIDAATTRPVAGATVYFAVLVNGLPAPTGTTRVLTDPQGRFVLRAIPAGQVTVTATKPGYVAGAYGKRSPSGTAQVIELAEGESRGDVTISLWKFGVVGGRITDESGEPIPGLQVRVLRRAIVAGKWQLIQSGNQPSTDDRGIYRVDSLVPGQYVVGVVSTSAAMPVELYDAYMQSIASGAPDFTRTIDPAASMSSSAGLRIGDQVLPAGASALGIGTAQSPSMRLDDQTRRLLVYPTVFYPSVPTVTQADIVTVGAGTEQSSIDFQLRPSPTVTVSGLVIGPDGPSPNTALQLLPSGVETLQREYGFEAATTISDRKGAFTFVGVVPGQYVIRVIRTPQRPQTTFSGVTTVVQIGSSTISSSTSSGPQTQPPIPNDPTLWGALSVSAGQTDLTGLSVVLRAGARIGGHVEFSGSAAKPAPAALAQITLTVDASDGRTAGANSVSGIISRLQVDSQGQLHSYQFPAGKYLIRASAAAPGWTFAGAFLNGTDVSASPFELGASDVENLVVRYTDHPADLSGTVRDDGRLVGRGSTVLLFPADSRGWTDYGVTARRFRSTVASTSGAYRFSGIADGEYLIAAVGGDVPADWQEAEFLKKLAPLASRVIIAEGDKKVQDLKVSAPR